MDEGYYCDECADWHESTWDCLATLWDCPICDAEASVEGDEYEIYCNACGYWEVAE